MHRSDPAAAAPEPNDSIDWVNVLSEVQVMLELNQKPNAAWQNQLQANQQKTTTAADSDASEPETDEHSEP